jgi:ribosome modulation factor
MPDNLTQASNGTPNIDPSQFASLKAELRFAIIAKHSAVAKLRCIRKRMEDAGADLKALDLSMKLEKLDDDVREILLRNTARYAAWSGKPIGTQASLFGADDAARPSDKARDELAGAAAFEAGYRAAQGGQKHDDNPYEAGSDWNQRWAQGWHAGAKVIEEVLAGKPPKEKRGGARRPGRRGARQAGASA